jgi:hypothetical protein
MPDQSRVRGLLEWSLAAFHAAILLTTSVLLLYSGGALGPLLAGLNTGLGLGLYGLLWLTTLWTTRQALRGIPWDALEQPRAMLGRLGRITLWGGANGGLFFLALAVTVIVPNLLAASLAGGAFGADALPALLFAGTIGTAVAFAAGAVAAVAFALLDGVLLALARWLAPEPRSQ